MTSGPVLLVGLAVLLLAGGTVWLMLRLRNRARRLELVVNAARDAMALIGPDHTYQYVNTAYLERTGRDRKQILSEHAGHIWGQRHYEMILKLRLAQAFAGREVSYEAWFESADREARYHRVTLIPCRQPGKPVSRVVVVSTDITDRHKDEQELQRVRHELEERMRERTGELLRANIQLQGEVKERTRLEQRLTEAKEAAERASRAKSEFLANMSHEVRTPLGAIVGMAEIGRDTVEDDDVTHLFRTILSEAGGLMNVLNTVLDFSKMEAGKLTLERMPFNLRYLVEDTAAGFALQAQRKGLELIAAIRPRAPENLVGDPGRLRQILVNLMGNAIKFTDHGEVSVVADLAERDQEGVLVRFEVQDTGMGIPTERQAAVFESFTQGDGSTSRTHGGTGLGTTIAKELAEMMGGSIGLESKPGRGSLFWFTARFGLQEETRSAAPDATGLDGRNILVVDDNPRSRRATAEHVAAWGARAATAGTAAKALDLLAQALAGGDPYHILITDLSMPDMDGFGLAGEVRARREYDAVPIVLLTEATMIGHGEACRQVGIQAYLPKPVKRDDLHRALQAVLSADQDFGDKDRDKLVTKHRLAETRRPLARVLVVEDHPTIREVARRHLENLGMDVTLAADGREAADLFGRMTFDLVLMDVEMPVMDGFEATRILRAREERVRKLAGDEYAERTPVLALTAHTGAEFRRRCLDAGMDDRLLKPMTRAALKAAVTRWLPDQPLGGDEPEPEQAGEAASGDAPRDEPMNVAQAVAEFGGDEPFVRNLALAFLERTAVQAARLAELAEQGQGAALADEAHAIKGGAASLAAFPLSEAARVVEDMARAGNLDLARLGVNAVQERLAELQHFASQNWPQPVTGKDS